MKTIIAGSRSITDKALVYQAVKESDFDITEVVSGGAKGVDKLGEQYAIECLIPIKLFRANWNKFGHAAGPLRNIEMAKYAEALIAIWNGTSTGTAHMIDQARRHGLKVFVKEVN